jgi:hypothetical protein
MPSLVQKRLTKSVKKLTTATKKRTTVRKMRGGGDAISTELLTGSKIPLRVQSSPDWVPAGSATAPPPYAIDLGEAMQSYLFGRPTPDSKGFMVASGLVEKSKGVIDMVGGKKKKRTSTTKKSTSTKKKSTSTKKKRSTSRK